VLPSIANGISRQPPILRSADQNEDELNTWVRLVDGVGRRPPTEHVAEIADGPLDAAFIHQINRDTTERYLVIISGGAIRVWDQLLGTPVTVNAPGGLSYLEGNPSDLRAFTVADYTFIVNTKKVCGLAAVGADAEPDPPYYRMPSNRIPTYRREVETDLDNQPQLMADTPYGDGYYSGGEYQYPPNPTLPTVLTGEVVSIEKLPETAPEGALYRVTGSTSGTFTSFYVIRRGAVWDECVAPGIQNAIDAVTMPHCLVREADGTFTFAPFSWSPRRVGDEGTNAKPTFIGRTINGLFFYQNRLGFLSDENVIFSAAGDFGNFWRTTVLDYIDSDVVDVAASSTGADGKVSILRNVIAFQDGLLVSSDQTQFSVTNGEDGLTPSSVAIRAVTHYEVNNRVRPVAVGTEVYFVSDGSGGTTTWEYSRLQDAEATSAADITAHVKGLIPSGVRTLTAAPDLNALFIGNGSDRLFVYQLYWNGNEKILSSWRRWQMPGDVLATAYLDGQLYLLLQRDGKVSIERLDLRLDALPKGQAAPVYLDRMVFLQGTYDPTEGRTRFTLPYTPTADKLRIIRPSSDPDLPGSPYGPEQFAWHGPRVVSVPGNAAQADTLLGETYRTHLVFSRQYPVNYQGQPLATGRLQLRTFTVNYSATATFTADVRPYGPLGPLSPVEVFSTKRSLFTGRVLGDDGNRLNSQAYSTASYTFTVYGDAAQAQITLWTESHTPATFVSAEWEGFYVNRTQG
jgi:hypothetical protein